MLSSPGNNKTGKANVQSVISLTKNTDLGYSFKEKSWTKKDMLNMKSFPRIRRLEGNQDLYPGSSAFNSFSRKTSCGAFLSTLYNFPIVHRAAHAVEPFLLYILLFLFNFTPFAFLLFNRSSYWTTTFVHFMSNDYLSPQLMKIGQFVHPADCLFISQLLCTQHFSNCFRLFLIPHVRWVGSWLGASYLSSLFLIFEIFPWQQTWCQEVKTFGEILFKSFLCHKVFSCVNSRIKVVSVVVWRPILSCCHHLLYFPIFCISRNLNLTLIVLTSGWISF